MTRIAKYIVLCALIAAAAWWLFADTYRHYAGGRSYIRVAYFADYQQHLMWQRIFDAFKARHPEIRIKPEFILGQRYEAKVRQQMVSKSAPDVILYQDEPLPGIAREGEFEDLGPYLNTVGYSLNLKRDFWPTSWESFVYEGRQYGIPIWGGNNLIYYNKKAFDRAGVPYPRDDWTLEEFLETCKALTRDFDGDGRVDQFGFARPGWVYFLPWFYGFGADLLDETHTVWKLYGPEAEAALQLYADLGRKYHVSPMREELGTMGEGVGFLTGRIAMVTSGPWFMPFLHDTDVDYDIVHIPRGPKGRGTRVTWDALAIYAGSKRKSDAWKFVHFAVGLEAAKIVCEYQRSLPALKAAREYFGRGVGRSSSYKFLEAFDYVRIQPISVHWNEMNRLMNVYCDELVLGKITVREMIAKMIRHTGIRDNFIVPDDARTYLHDRRQ